MICERRKRCYDMHCAEHGHPLSITLDAYAAFRARADANVCERDDRLNPPPCNAVTVCMSPGNTDRTSVVDSGRSQGQMGLSQGISITSFLESVAWTIVLSS